MQVLLIEAATGTLLGAIEQARAQLGRTYPLIIDGDEITRRETFEVRAPANHDTVLGSFQKGTKADVDRAVAAAKAAFPAWSRRPWQERVDLIRKAGRVPAQRATTYEHLVVHDDPANDPVDERVVSHISSTAIEGGTAHPELKLLASN